MTLRRATLAIAALALSACASAPSAKDIHAPAPAKSIDVSKFYTGRWYEIARTPMKLTDGCVAGTTDYSTNKAGKLIDTDACRDKTPSGKIKTFAGPVTVMNPEANKIDVNYRVFAVFSAKRSYWMLDHADDYTWFIVSDPQFANVSFFTREPRPSKERIDMLNGRVKALGYDPTKLEYPATFPPGMQ